MARDEFEPLEYSAGTADRDYKLRQIIEDLGKEIEGRAISSRLESFTMTLQPNGYMRVKVKRTSTLIIR
jgi:hypothetical protein